MSVLFSDDDFSNACAELDLPNVADYEFFTESQDVKIYRKYNKESCLYQYKIYGALKDVRPDICAQVYMDLEYRKQWDKFVCELKEVDDQDEKAIYWKVNYPFPLSKRDYVYRRELRQLTYKDRPAWVVLAQSVRLGAVPPRKGVVRVDEYVQSLAITSDGNHGTNAFITYYDNPGGSIPTWLINWAASKGVPSFLDQMNKACSGYTEYLKTQPSRQGLSNGSVQKE